MPRIFIRTFVVPPQAIDVNGHVNNVEYVRWMQEVAVEHSAARGWTFERYQAIGAGWVTRTHFVEYLRPAFAGDTISALTWVAGYKSRSSARRYLFWRAADQQLLARAETHWVFVDARTGRPVSIPEELRTSFEIVPDDEEALRMARACDPRGAEGGLSVR